jgi:hypothetical protein
MCIVVWEGRGREPGSGWKMRGVRGYKTGKKEEKSEEG